MKKNFIKFKKGFTILELMVTIFIFATMTTYLLAKYGTFNQSTLLTNLAYDVALTLRTAQSYGLNVKGVTTNGSADPSFNYPYGVHFEMAGSQWRDGTCIVFFADSNSNGRYSPSYSLPANCNSVNANNKKISTYLIKRGSFIKRLCVDACDPENLSKNSRNSLDITFKRPDPDAIINATGSIDNSYDDPSPHRYAEITLQSTDGSTIKVIVNKTGYIAIQ